MKEKVLAYVIALFVKQLTPELAREFASKSIKFIEDKVLESKSTVDDALILPLVEMLRKTFDIE